jgi:hypothetical protein
MLLWAGGNREAARGALADAAEAGSVQAIKNAGDVAQGMERPGQPR